MTEKVDEAKNNAKGMRTFTMVWLGQMASMLGSSMTMFGLMIWAWEKTGVATALALIGFFGFAPAILMTPIAGHFVDRWNRKLTMIFSDLAGGIGTIMILILYNAEILEIWHLYVIAAFIGIFTSFQFPAYSAAVTMMINKKNYGRATAMTGIGHSIASIFGPISAAFFIVFIGIKGIMMIDIATFCLAIGILLFVKIPQPKIAEDIGQGIKGIFKDAVYGFKYIFSKKPLFGLQMTYFTTNFFSNMSMILLAPMILAVTASNEIELASVMASAGIGGLAGGITMTIWGGSKEKKILVIMSVIAIEGTCQMFFGLGSEVIVWSIVGFILGFSGPFVMGSSQAIWQSKVEPNKQGRVFAARGFIAMGAGAVSMAMAGPLADLVFEPSMTGGGLLGETFGWLLGTDVGSGMRLMFLLCGMGSTLTAITAYSIKRVRNLETLVPDFDELEHDEEGKEGEDPVCDDEHARSD